jgi:hypothetical protein
VTARRTTRADLIGPDAPLLVPVHSRVGPSLAGLGMSRGAAYQSVRDGVFPVIRVGRRLLVPVGALLAVLGEHDLPSAGQKVGDVAAGRNADEVDVGEEVHEGGALRAVAGGTP